jgi:surface protein
MGKRKALFSVNRAGGVSTSFIMSVKTDNIGTSNNDQFTIPTTGSGYSYNVDTVEHSLTGETGDVTLTFASAGTYDVEISGTFPRILFNNGGDKAKLLDISNWGDIGWTSMDSAFYGCSSLTNITATDAPDLTSCSDFTSMFLSATSLATISNVDSWDMSNATMMPNMFYNTVFNSDIGSWDVSGVTNMQNLFRGSSFNQDIDSWNTSSVTNMNRVFRDSSFDQDISSWDINQVTAFSGFAQGATFSTANYDAILIAWDAQGTMSYSGTVHFGSSQYTSGGAAETARTSLISKWGGITDGGAA